MPQKRNPYSLTFIRGLARNMIGRYISIATTGFTPSGQPDNRIFVYYDLPDCLDETRKATDLFCDVLNKCTFNKKRLAQSAQEGFTIATDLTDFLVARYNIDNRTAYNIVTKTVEKSCNRQEPAIISETIYRAAQELGVRIPEIRVEDFRKNLSIEKLIEKRKGIGGAGSHSLGVMIHECQAEIARAVNFFKRKTPSAFKKRFYRKIKDTAGIL